MSQDSFNVYGDEIHFGPWVVGALRNDVPPMVRYQVEGWLYEMDGERCDAAHDGGYSEARADYLDEIKGLNKQIAQLKTLVHEMDAQLRENVR